MGYCSVVYCTVLYFTILWGIVFHRCDSPSHSYTITPIELASYFLSMLVCLSVLCLFLLFFVLNCSCQECGHKDCLPFCMHYITLLPYWYIFTQMVRKMYLLS